MPFAKKSGSKVKATNASSVVLKYRYFGKASLAAYPNEDGAPFYMPKDQDEKKFFAKGSIMDSRDKTNGELFHRLGMGVCLAASSLDHGCPYVAKRIPGFDESSSAADMKKAFAKTGLIDIKDILLSEDGIEFQKSMKTLNVGMAQRPSQADVENAISVYMDVMNQERLRKACSFSASLYLFTSTFLEHLDLHARPKNGES